MKNKIILWLIVLTAISSVEAQTASIGRDANVSLFSGYLLKTQNTNNNAYYYGIYADYPIIKKKKFNLGIWGVYDASNFQDNIAPYQSSTSEMAGGLNTGLYLAPLYSLKTYYFGFAAGYKNSREIGIVDKKDYYSEGKQSDNMIVANLNLNRYRKAKWLPRTQVIANWQESFSSSKTVSENSLADTIADHWNRGFYEMTLKQSLVSIPLGIRGDRLLEPKLGATYHHYQAGNPTAISLIGEISLHKLFADDFLSVTFQYKHYTEGNTDYMVYGVSVNLLRLIQKKNY